jgi:hypothetical protein
MGRNSWHEFNPVQAVGCRLLYLDDKEGCEQCLGPDHQIHMGAPLGIRRIPGEIVQNYACRSQVARAHAKFSEVVYDITLTAAPPSTNILVNGLPLTYPFKYSGLMCRFLAGLSKMAYLASTSCAISPSSCSSSRDASSCTT